MAAYGSLCTEFYDLDKPNAPVGALSYYLDRARRAGGRVLEPMCGSGRFLIPMSLAGVPIDGVDSSPAMLSACRVRARSLGIDVSIFLQELASLDLPHRYSMAFIPSGSIGLVTDEGDLRTVFSRLRAHMEPGATLLLELASVDDQTGRSAEPECRTVTCADGSSITYTCIASRTEPGDTVCFSGTYARRHGSRIVETETEELVLRLYSSQSLEAQLVASGFIPTKSPSPPHAAENGCTLVEASVQALLGPLR